MMLVLLGMLVSCQPNSKATNYDLLFERALKNKNDSLIYYAEELTKDSIQWLNLSMKFHEEYYAHFNLDMIRIMDNSHNPAIQKLIGPLHAWKEFEQYQDSSSVVNMLEMLQQSNYWSKTARYSLLMCQKSPYALELLIDQTISNLERKYHQFPKKSNDMIVGYQKSWTTLMLSYANYIKYQNNKSSEILKSAYKYSQEYDNSKFKSNIDQELTLFYKPHYIHEQYQKVILSTGQPAEIINFLTNQTFESPTDQNIELLINYFDSIGSGPFLPYWHKYVNSQFKPLKQSTIEKLSNHEPELLSGDKWVLIDFWGTWCVPCVAEMPELVNFIEEYQAMNNFAFTSIAYDSKEKVQKFLNKKQYSFSVIIDDEKEIINDFNIYEYPSKVLISPENKFYLIPATSLSWKLYVKNYIQSKITI